MKLEEVIFNGFIRLERWQPCSPFKSLVVRATDSVAGLLYDRTNHRVLLVRQQRAAMVRDDNQDGFIIEAVAGRFDYKTNPKALLVKEASEEAGVTITEDDVVLLNGGIPLALSAGVLTERSYLAYAEISLEAVAEGEVFGVVEEGEHITRIWQDADAFIAETHEDLRVWAFAQYLKNKIYVR